MVPRLIHIITPHPSFDQARLIRQQEHMVLNGIDPNTGAQAMRLSKPEPNLLCMLLRSCVLRDAAGFESHHAPVALRA